LNGVSLTGRPFKWGLIGPWSVSEILRTRQSYEETDRLLVYSEVAILAFRPTFTQKRFGSEASRDVVTCQLFKKKFIDWLQNSALEPIIGKAGIFLEERLYIQFDLISSLKWTFRQLYDNIPCSPGRTISG